MRAADVQVGMEVQVGHDRTWTDDPRRARVEAFERRRRQDTQRQVRIRWLLPDGTEDPEPTGSVWWRPADLEPWEPWREAWGRREARRAHRRSIVGRLTEALELAGLADLVSVQPGRHVQGTVHMVIGDLVDTELVTARLRRLAVDTEVVADRLRRLAGQ